MDLLGSSRHLDVVVQSGNGCEYRQTAETGPSRAFGSVLFLPEWNRSLCAKPPRVRDSLVDVTRHLLDCLAGQANRCHLPRYRLVQSGSASRSGSRHRLDRHRPVHVQQGKARRRQGRKQGATNGGNEGRHVALEQCRSAPTRGSKWRRNSRISQRKRRPFFAQAGIHGRHGQEPDLKHISHPGAFQPAAPVLSDKGGRESTAFNPRLCSAVPISLGRTAITAAITSFLATSLGNTTSVSGDDKSRSNVTEATIYGFSDTAARRPSFTDGAVIDNSPVNTGEQRRESDESVSERGQGFQGDCGMIVSIDTMWPLVRLGVVMLESL